MIKTLGARELLNDRFSVSLALALGLHALVLLGIGFTLEINPIKKAAETLDVVLVNWRSENPPEEAEFLAQAAQEGGGEFEEAEKPSQPLSPQVPSLAEGDMPVSSEEVLPQEAPETRETLTVDSDDALQVTEVNQIEQPDAEIPSAQDLMQESMQLARMQPGSDRQVQFKSKLPRRKFVAANTKEYEYAAYMQAWVSKVERVGTLNYPSELKSRGIAGSLLMTVGINSDGSVESIQVLEGGSGIPELDAAAMRIVRLAAPYSPLPADIAQNIDVLHITRTWKFSAGNRFE